VTVKGTFRSDAELVSGPEGRVRLQRRIGPRLLSGALVVAAALLAVYDARVGRPWIAAVHALLGVGFLGLLLRAELDHFSFDGHSAVRRWLTLSGLRQARLQVKVIARIAVERAGKRARAWIETKSGEQYALVEGEAGRIEAMAEKLAQAIRLAKSEPGKLLH
jgi:hypothetical protein